MAFTDKLEEIQEQIQSIDWTNIRADNIGSWPLPVKTLAWLAAFSAIMAAGYFVLIEDLQNRLTKELSQEKSLKQDFQRKAGDAANLEVYRQQMEEMSQSFEAMISQLPSDTEVPGLLEDITSKGVSSGLEFKTIDLESEQKKEYYVQLPISIEAEGTYHDMGAFVGGVAGLPRIVTLSDFSIKPVGSQYDNSKLQFEVLAHTYRYNDKGANKNKSSRKKR